MLCSTHSKTLFLIFLAGKVWGSKGTKQILCLHGWQDNANTFDTLIPQLPPEFCYIAIDLPGHGLSSHYPKGNFYKLYDMILALRRVQKYLNLNRVSLIGHSFGGMISFLFSSCFSNDVNFFVAIDAIKPLGLNAEDVIQSGAKVADKLLSYDSGCSVEYNRDDLTKSWIAGSKYSLTEQSCQILMERGTIEENGKYKLTRDPRVKRGFLNRFTQSEYLLMAEKVICNVLYIKAADVPYFEKKEDVIEFVNVLKKKAKCFEEHQLPGTHHLHLNNPEVVAPVISAFIKSAIQLSDDF